MKNTYMVITFVFLKPSCNKIISLILLFLNQLCVQHEIQKKILIGKLLYNIYVNSFFMITNLFLMKKSKRINLLTFILLDFLIMKINLDSWHLFLKSIQIKSNMNRNYYYFFNKGNEVRNYFQGIFLKGGGGSRTWDIPNSNKIYRRQLLGCRLNHNMNCLLIFAKKKSQAKLFFIFVG